MMSFIIAGGGLSGLSCAHKLLENGKDVIIVESRAEIGTPTRSPGYSSKKLEIIENIIDDISGIEWRGGYSFRREWLEKRLAINLAKQGCEIITRTRIIEGNEDHIIFQGAGKLASGKLSGKVVDLLGVKSTAAGWFGNCSALNEKPEVSKWNGGICIDENILDMDYSFKRADGLIECWWQGELDKQPPSWLEFMSGEHQGVPDAANSIERGLNLADQLL